VKLRAGDGEVDGACENHESPFRNRLYATTVHLDGLPATLLLDTGATRTMLSLASPLARRFSNRTVAGGQTQGIGGAAEETSRIPSIAVLRGGETTTIDLRLGTGTNRCGPDGLLGMDALKRCVAVLGQRMTLTCSA
jgi:hypothetical protein